MSLTSRQRAYLMSLSSNLEPVVHIGKSGLTDEVIEAVLEVINKRELIKLSVLKNCVDEPKEIARMIAENTESNVVHVIGRKIVLYRQKKDDPKIVLPE